MIFERNIFSVLLELQKIYTESVDISHKTFYIIFRIRYTVFLNCQCLIKPNAKI